MGGDVCVWRRTCCVPSQFLYDFFFCVCACVLLICRSFCFLISVLDRHSLVSNVLQISFSLWVRLFIPFNVSFKFLNISQNFSIFMVSAFYGPLRKAFPYFRVMKLFFAFCLLKALCFALYFKFHHLPVIAVLVRVSDNSCLFTLPCELHV